MKIVIFGLTISSSWGNGHATLWRGLCRALAALGHRIVFFERDVPYYASTRDLRDPTYATLVLYQGWEEIRGRAAAELADADAAVATSYCPDAVAATALMLDAPRPLTIFYDLDTPVTLSRLADGEAVHYLGPRGLADFDLVFSYTGADALIALRDRLGARRIVPLYGHVDPELHRPAEAFDHYRADLSYLGTYAADRQAALERLFIAPARQRPRLRFLIGGAQYPAGFPWASNIFFVRHMPPAEHPHFFSSSRLTLNVTRDAMAKMGACPSGRLFEAASCGTAILSDRWDRLEDFFEPGREILVATSTEGALAAIDMDDAALRRIGLAARERVLAQHTSAHRARAFVAAIEASPMTVHRTAAAAAEA
jgi:spore maturation protein CgeB